MCVKYFKNKDKFMFYKAPSEFNKYTKKEVLQYSIGANMYIPGNKTGIFDKIFNNGFNEVGAITFCCEDSIAEDEVVFAENNIISILDKISESLNDENGNLSSMPLIFIRVRNSNHFKSFSEKMNKKRLELITGFVFPKFSSNNGYEYLRTLEEISNKYNEKLYGMPILEGEELIYKENRFLELEKVHAILNFYSSFILNIRVGGTDFSSRFGLRRSVNHTIYDIRVVSDCLIDILNFFLRMESDFVISGPVWEYFSYDKDSLEVKGLIKELDLDIQNGFFGKTIIHPTQIKYVNERYIVCYEDYIDALNILNSSGGVFKGNTGNRMNEVAPHTNWAKKIISRAEIFGVLNKGAFFE